VEDGQLVRAVNEGKEEHNLENKLEKVAAVLEANLGQVRSSPRLQHLRDEHTLAKAEGRAAKKNLELRGGMLSSNPLVSIDKSFELDCLQQIGITCGESDQCKLDNIQHVLASNLKQDNLDQDDREPFDSDSGSNGEGIYEFEINALKNLCEEMMDEVFDETSFPLNCELNCHLRKDKFHAKSCLRKTCKNRRAKYIRGVPR
jgi:hypothetical protein